MMCRVPEGKVEAGRRRELVRRGYDAISRLYRDDEGRSVTEVPPDWIAYHEAWSRS